MAGKGTRFIGYSELPKPMILYNNEPLFVHAVESIKRLIKPATITFIVREEHCKEFGLYDEIRRYYPDLSTVFVLVLHGDTRGAAETVFAGMRSLLEATIADFNDGMLVMDCDLEFNSSILNRKNLESVENAVFSFNSVMDKYSFAEVDDQGYVVRTAEKKPISNNALTAPYYFGNLGDYADAYRVLDANYDNNHEMYVSNIYNILIHNMGRTVKLYPDCWDFVTLGTPEDIEKLKQQDAC